MTLNTTSYTYNFSLVFKMLTISMKYIFFLYNIQKRIIDINATIILFIIKFMSPPIGIKDTTIIVITETIAVTIK